MNRFNLLLCLSMAACTVTPGNPGGTPTGGAPSGNTGTPAATGATKEDKTAVCDGSSSTCSKYVKACKLDCKSLTDAAEKTACTAGCADALDGCVAACKAASDPEAFDAEEEDFDGKPEPKPTTSDTCGNADQLCCAEAGLDECQAGLLKLTNTDDNGDTVCGCVTPCKKNIIEQANQGKDDCDATHICLAQDYTKPVSASNKLFCVASQCDPAKAHKDGFSIDEGCGFPQTSCSSVIKPAFGFCNLTCVPGLPDQACPNGGTCYATYTTYQNTYYPANVCSTKTTPAVALGASCAFGVTGDVNTGVKGTDNCAVGQICDLKTDKCVKNCGIEGPTGPAAPSGALCAGGGFAQCNPIKSDIAGIPAPSGADAVAWKAQGDSIAADQGLMYECIAAQP